MSTAIRLRACGALLLVFVLLYPSAAEAQLAPAPVSNRFGIGDDYGGVTSGVALNRMREAGFGWVYLTVFWNLVNPQQGVYNWAYLDAEIALIESAGLNIYARVVFPPAWATGVSYTNAEVPYYCILNPGHPDCNNPARIPTTGSFQAFVTQLVQRYKNRIKYWGFGTEVHNNVFWQGTPDQFITTILRPGYVLVKSLDPSATVVGPDEDIEGSLEYLLSKEAQYGRFCDVISFHVLRHSGGSLSRLDSQLKPVIDKYGAGRPFWLTEAGHQTANDPSSDSIQAAWLQEFLAGVIQRPWIDKTFIYRMKNATASETDFGLLNVDDSPKQSYNLLRALLSTQSTPTFYYLAEGATGAFFDLDISLANPNGVGAPVKVTFLRSDGVNFVQTKILGPGSRDTIKVDAVPGLESAAVSAVIESTTGAQLAVERTMFWDGQYYGGHGGTAVPSPGTRWYFAEGSQGFFDTYVLLANSNIAATSVKVTFLLDAGAPIVRNYIVNANSRFNVFAGDVAELLNKAFAIAVESDLPIIAERAMYFGARRFWDGGHESAGVREPSRNWFHAEGATGSFFDTYILVGNPNPGPATVTFTFLLDSGISIVRTKTIPALARLTVNVEVEDPLLANAAVSTTVSADQPIISERAMYWEGEFNNWREAHNSFGLTETGPRWALAEGRVGFAQSFETYILLANPNASAAAVRVTFLRTNGTTVVKNYTVPGTSRFNIYVNGVPELANETFGVLIESTNGLPIAVERAMYWNALGVVWAGGTNATATKLN